MMDGERLEIPVNKYKGLFIMNMMDYWMDNYRMLFCENEQLQDNTSELNESDINTFIDKLVDSFGINENENSNIKNELIQIKDTIDTPEKMKQYIIDNKDNILQYIDQCNKQGKSKLSEFLNNTCKFVWVVLKHGIPFVWKNKGLLMFIFLWCCICNKLDRNPIADAGKVVSAAWNAGETTLNAMKTINDNYHKAEKTVDNIKDKISSTKENVSSTLDSLYNKATAAFNGLGNDIMKKFFYKLWSKFLTVFGDIKIFKYPLWFVYDPDDFEITGNDVLEIMSFIQPGDVILRGYNKYCDGKFIPDPLKYSHGAIYIGDNKVIHAVAEGVSETNIVDFTRCDRIAIFKPASGQKRAIRKAREFLKKKTPYDFGFQRGVSSIYCFELCGECYDKLDIPRFVVSKLFGLIKRKDVYLAESFFKSKDFECVYQNNKNIT